MTSREFEGPCYANPAHMQKQKRLCKAGEDLGWAQELGKQKGNVMDFQPF